MSFLRLISTSFTDCFDSIYVNGISHSFSGISSIGSRQVSSDLNRLQTMAKLGENMYDITMKMGELDLQAARYEAEAKKNIARGMSDSDLKPYFQRVREVNIQRRALEKSGRTLMATVSSLESQANIQQIKNVLSYTVDTHRMAREAVADDVTSESLLQGFEQISSTIEQEKIVLDTLDAHINDLREEPIEEGALEHESADFLVWKNSLSRKIEPTENARPARKEQAIADVPLVSHMSIAM